MWAAGVDGWGSIVPQPGLWRRSSGSRESLIKSMQEADHHDESRGDANAAPGWSRWHPSRLSPLESKAMNFPHTRRSPDAAAPAKANAHVLVLLLAAAVLLGAHNARAETINVDTSWSRTEINNILDNDPLTKGRPSPTYPAGQPDAQPGDIVQFSAGTFGPYRGTNPPLGTTGLKSKG